MSCSAGSLKSLFRYPSSTLNPYGVFSSARPSIVLPRIVAAIVSVIVLMVYFTVVAVMTAALLGQSVLGPSPPELRAGISRALLPHDLVLFVSKGVGLGAILGWFACHYGLGVQSSPTEVPRQASKAVVNTLLGCVAYDTALTLVFYWFAGPPLR